MAVRHDIDAKPARVCREFVRRVRRYCSVQLEAGRQLLTAVDPLPDDLRDAIAKINDRHAHHIGPIRTSCCCTSPDPLDTLEVPRLTVVDRYQSTSIPSRFFRGGDGSHDCNFAFQLVRIQPASA